MLEEVAVAAWHAGGDRVVPLKFVAERLRSQDLADDLQRIAERPDGALSALLDSFFCRAFSGAEHRVVEFTHKVLASSWSPDASFAKCSACTESCI